MTSYLDLFITSPLSFGGLEQVDREDALYIVVGAPFDSTSSFRGGQRFAPYSIRLASSNIESNGYYLRDLYIEDLRIRDEGDIALPPGNASEAVERIRKVTSELVGIDKRLVVIGGEHIITLGVIKGLVDVGIRPCIVVFDAHYDLRWEYMGEKLSHATVMRRILELFPTRIVYIGVRAYDKEEVDLAVSKPLIEEITVGDVNRLGPINIASSIKRFLDGCKHVHITIDMDAYDTAYAPGVSTPEPGGLTPRELLYILHEAIDDRVVSIDIVEVTPPYDCNGITSILAAKTLQEALLTLESKRRRRTGRG
ncbi:MAG: agmatinase [Desulfurococcales archaeon]|nr:agmatinase [Desulfurococcales archaeon]